MFFLGVDGGGTKTAFLLMNQQGQRVSATTLGSLDWFQIGAQGFEQTLECGIEYVCREAAIDRCELAYSMLGIPCLGDELIEEEPLLNEIVSRLLRQDRFSLVNDAEVGWAGSLACQPGIHLVCGTGTIGYGVNSTGRTARAGGWGHDLGDEGSAYWLGKRLLAAFTREADGREQRSHIYEIVRNYFALTDDFQLLKILSHEWNWNRERIAGLAKLLHQAAEAGEQKAVQAFEQAANELTFIIRSIANQLDFSRAAEIPISYSGGVFLAGDYIMKPLQKRIADYKYSLMTPILEPAAGAALYAFKRLHPDVDLKKLTQNLQA